ncbi:MAG TPA: hypothetical protein VGN16_15135 [Acidobacteriaceae bacterium]|jgi:uncharacterized protein YdaU (DUF1376 family)
MAARWQQWMPFHIDRFRGSPDVQAMHPAARCGYLYLLAWAWQTDDCSLPDDDMDLAAASGLGDDMWPLYAPRIRRKFVVENGRLSNATLRAEWEDARWVYEKRSAAAKNTNKVRGHGEARAEMWVRTESERSATKSERSAGDERIGERYGRRYGERDGERDGEWSAEPDGQRSVIEEQALRFPGTGTLTGTETTLKPSRAGREGGSRYVLFRSEVEAHAKQMRVLFVWDPAAAKQLNLLLDGAPDLTLAIFQTCLSNRARSPGVPHGEHPRAWLPKVLKYQQGPLNAFGRREEEGNGSTLQGKSGRSIDAAREAIRILRGREAGADCDVAGEVGDPPAGQAGHG